MSRRRIPGAVAPGRDPLLDDSWSYVEHTTLDDVRAADWSTLNAQRELYRGRTLADQVLRLLAVSKDDPTFGYQVNNYHHSLQTATLMYRDGLDDEQVVMGLLHDVGFTICPEQHAEFAANILRPYLSERTEWILLMHPVFQAHHIHEYPGVDSSARERLRGHPWFEDCARFVERYDIVSIDPRIEVPPLSFFEPMVRSLFEHPRHGTVS